MSNFQLNKEFEVLTPSEAQRMKIQNKISSQLENLTSTTTISRTRRKWVSPLAACLFVFLLSATVYGATNEQIVSAVKDVHRIFFANGGSVEIEKIDSHHTNVRTDGSQSEWLVKEQSRKLLLTVNGEVIDISKPLSEKGYYYYDYQDQSNVLHRVYIVKNAGGKKDYAERWYSQMEWLPDQGVGGGSRGLSGPLAAAIMGAESDAKQGNGNLDAELQVYLKQYWEKYGE